MVCNVSIFWHAKMGVTPSPPDFYAYGIYSEFISTGRLSKIKRKVIGKTKLKVGGKFEVSFMLVTCNSGP